MFLSATWLHPSDWQGTCGRVSGLKGFTRAQVLGAVQFAEEKRNRWGEGQRVGMDRLFATVKEQVRPHGVRQLGVRPTRSSRECKRTRGLGREHMRRDVRGGGCDRGNRRVERVIWRETR